MQVIIYLQREFWWWSRCRPVKAHFLSGRSAPIRGCTLRKLSTLGKFLNSWAEHTHHRNLLCSPFPPLLQPQRGCATFTHVQNRTSCKHVLHSYIHNTNTHIHTMLKNRDTYDHCFYLDELVQGGIMSVLELFTDVEEVDLRARHHDTNQGSVVRAQALQRQKQHGCTFILLCESKQTQRGLKACLPHAKLMPKTTQSTYTTWPLVARAITSCVLLRVIKIIRTS